MLELILAGALWVSLAFYVVTAGADFGAGVWYLFARGPRGAAQREVIAKAIGPIWEANHVWLILAVTILFTAFPRAFAAVSVALHLPLTIALIGIVLRGAAFVFRRHDVAPSGDAGGAQERWEQVFAFSSFLVPIWLGVGIGSLASGSLIVHEGDFLDRFVRPWAAWFPFLVGSLTLAVFAELASVYLVLETTDEALRADFRRRAMGAAVAVACLSLAALLISYRGAPRIWHGLTDTSWGAAILASAALCGAGLLWSLYSGRFRWARRLAAGQALLILLGWGLSQVPYLIVPDVTIYGAAAPRLTLEWLLGALLGGAALLFPSLWYLYRVFKGGTLFGTRDR